MKKSNYELSVSIVKADNTLKNIPEYGSNGLTYVLGNKGQKYTIKVRNNTAKRCLAVVSVDGLGVLDGKPCTADSRGYVLQGYSSCDIAGWRINNDKVAEFVFSDKPVAMSTQSNGSDLNCGVIAVKIFDEKYIAPTVQTVYVKDYVYPRYYGWPYWGEPLIGSGITYSACSDSGQSNAQSQTFNASLGADTINMSVSSLSANTAQTAVASFNCSTDACNASLDTNAVKRSMSAPVTAKVADFNIGTGWGSEKYDAVSSVSFERGNELETITLYYSDSAGLKAAGIDVNKKPAIEKPLPQAFAGFCTPPKIKAV